MPKSPPRLMKASDLSFIPRFAYGDQAQAARLCGTEDGSELGCGFGRMSRAEIPWTIKYDEILLVLEGSLTVRTADGDLVANKHDTVWLPAGTELTYVTDDAMIFYAIHPANWAEAAEADQWK